MAKELSEEEKMKQLAAKMREAEYKGLSEEEIQEKEREKEMHRKRNIEILEDTLDIFDKGSYIINDKEINLHFSIKQIKEAKVFLPEEIDTLDCNHVEITDEECLFHCESIDALELAKRTYEKVKDKVLVLNLASATTPGGHTRKGASAQEEDLCRRTSLLLSLESEDAKRYYDYNNVRKTRLGSNGIVLSPYVEVIKDSTSKLLEQPFPIAVMSCAAPMVRLGLEGISEEEYEKMLYHRIQGMLIVAAVHHYHYLILGAFGCGVYGNDAAKVSDLFYQVINEFQYQGKTSMQLFNSIEFAILCKPDKDYNYKEFCRNFASNRQKPS